VSQVVGSGEGQVGIDPMRGEGVLDPEEDQGVQEQQWSLEVGQWAQGAVVGR